MPTGVSVTNIVATMEVTSATRYTTLSPQPFRRRTTCMNSPRVRLIGPSRKPIAPSTIRKLLTSVMLRDSGFLIPKNSAGSMNSSRKYRPAPKVMNLTMFFFIVSVARYL